MTKQILRVSPEDSKPVEGTLVRVLTREEAEQEDKVFWHNKTPAERLAAAEQLRQIAYGHKCCYRPHSSDY